MSNLGLAVLLIWHVGSVVVWLGSAVVVVTAVLPSVGDQNQADMRAFLLSFLPRLSKVLGGATISAVVAGVLLYGYIAYVPTSITPEGWGTVFALLGGVLGLVAAFLTLGVALPLASRFMDPGAQMSNGPRYTVLDEETIIGGLIWVMRGLVVILSFAFALMIMGAYT